MLHGVYTVRKADGTYIIREVSAETVEAMAQAMPAEWSGCLVRVHDEDGHTRGWIDRQGWVDRP